MELTSLKLCLESLDAQVSSLKRDFQAHENDRQLLSHTLELFQVIHRFIFRIEQITGNYSDEFKKLSAKHIMGAIDLPVVIDDDFLDNENEIAQKKLFQQHSAECILLFENLCLDYAFVFKLYRRINLDNYHSMTTTLNLRKKEYVLGLLHPLQSKIEAISPLSMWHDDKDALKTLVNRIIEIYLKQLEILKQLSK